jgi:hypothetical protein
MTARFAEQNAAMLRARSLAVTPSTLYLSHFAGAAGAVAILSAPDNVDAVSIMAGADATGRTTREKTSRPCNMADFRRENLLSQECYSVGPGRSDDQRSRAGTACLS